MHEADLCIREMPIQSGGREVIVATEAAVFSTNLRTGEPVLDVLRMDGATFPDRIPLLDTHDRKSIRSVVGSVTDLHVEGDKLVGRLSVSDAEPVIQAKVREGHIRAVSVGSSPIETTRVLPGHEAVANGRSYRAPDNHTLHVNTRWRARECSLCAIGADPGAHIRSRSTHSLQGGYPMPSTLLLDQCRSWPEYFRLQLRAAGEQLPDNTLDMVRAGLSNVDGLASFSGALKTAILDGYHAASDTTAGWVRTVPLPNFITQQTAYVDTPIRLSKITRGGTAATVSFGISPTGWRLARFGLQVTFDDQDIVDNADIGLMQLGFAEAGAAVRRLIPDLVYSLLLSNESLADGVALFHSSRGNTASGGGSALSETSLDSGIGAIGAQTLADESGDPVHVGLSAGYLVVPPAKFGLAKRLVKNMGDESSLVVRGESRLTTTGVVDPRDDEIVQGNGNNWLLAAPHEQAAGIVVGLLNGQAEPTITSYELGQGQWGVGFDVKFDVGVAAVNGKPLYLSVGQ